jgi:hypothetical protein
VSDDKYLLDHLLNGPLPRSRYAVIEEERKRTKQHWHAKWIDSPRYKLTNSSSIAPKIVSGLFFKLLTGTKSLTGG